MKHNYFASYLLIMIFLTATVQKGMARSKFIDNLYPLSFCNSSELMVDDYFSPSQFSEAYFLRQNNFQPLHLTASIFSQINTPSEIQEFKMFPNPASQGFVNITSKKNANKEILIYDVLGKMVLKTNIKQKRLDISTLSSGIYILKATEGKQTSTRKLVVQ
ncbi:T9SS type A sorting domain-containing protein [Zhouia sp. PK063]|uniref:T9SS type A sorting domain-containing protein n=1 Tax=Zhouia sp. PK063 TaxID=3373602 RepID=UPI0037B9E1BE